MRGAPPRPASGQPAARAGQTVVRATVKPTLGGAPGKPAQRPAPAPPPPLPDDLELDFSAIFGGDLLAEAQRPAAPKPAPAPKPAAPPVVKPSTPPKPAAKPAAPAPPPADEPEIDLAELFGSIPEPPPLPPAKPQSAAKPAAPVARPAPAPAPAKPKPAPAPVPVRPQAAAVARPAARPAPAPLPGAPAPVRPAAAAFGGDLSSPKGKSKALAETVIASMCDRLVQETRRKGGTLTLADVERLIAEFWRKTEALQVVFEKSFEEYVKARERAVGDQARNYPFDRVLVREFEHLFAVAGPVDGNKLLRRMLPGFFMAMNKMLGEDVVEDYQERCRKIVQRVRAARGAAFKWPDVYEDRDAKALVVDALVAIAGYFQDVEKRSAWFLNIVNNHLAPPPPNAAPAIAQWQLAPTGFRRFLRALFRALRDELKAPQGRTRITERYGIEACLAVTETVDQVFAE